MARLFRSVGDFYAEGMHFSREKWPNFTPEELACNCPSKQFAEMFCEGHFYYDPDFFDALQRLRNWAGHPLHITSAKRCPGRNRHVRGSENSMHLKAIAVDISAHNIQDRPAFYRKAVELGFKGIGRYRTFIHLDRRDRPARWWGKDAKSMWT